VKQNKPPRPFEHLTERSGVGWSAKRSVAAVLARAAKKILPKRSAGVEIFLSRLYTLASMFCGTKGAIDEYLFTCVVFVRST